MKIWGLGSYAIGSAAITVSLAGCGGSQPLIGAPGARTQTSAIASASPLLHSYKVLYSFGRSPDGARPDAGLTAVKGTLYGTTDAGGTSDRGTVYSISTDGAEKVLYSFGGSPYGADPLAGLINVNGALYGTTYFGGSHDYGTVYRISTDGAETVMWRFDGAVDGAHPEASLVLATDTGRYKALYGTTRDGGLWDKGTVYEFYFDRTRTEVRC